MKGLGVLKFRRSNVRFDLCTLIPLTPMRTYTFLIRACIAATLVSAANAADIAGVKIPPPFAAGATTDTY